LIHHSGNPDGIFISHSHYDHILDVPVFADDWEKDERKKGRKKDIIPVYGSDSAGNYLWHFPEISKKFQLLQSEKEISLGNWKITGLESEHGKAVLGRIAYAGEITKKSPRPVRARDFRMGKIYSFMMQISGVTIVHHGSAGFRKGMYDGKRADILFLGVAGWKYSREYLAETIGMLQPKVVVPIHFDNFFHKRFQPETDKKPQILWDVSLEKFMRKVEREYPQTRLILLEPGGSIIWNHTAGKTGKKNSPAD
jgi:L-ascorbate metabolism protein UlaG (beta-lactamase superfamily)